jgi:hypothetical protein
MPAITRNNYIQDKGFAVHAGPQPGTDLSLVILQALSIKYGQEEYQ